MFTRSVIASRMIEYPDFQLSRVAELELHSMVRAEEDMVAIYNQIIGLEDEFKMLLKAKETSQYHQQLELERDRRIINESRTNIESLLGQLSLYTSEANNINSENLAALELCKEKSQKLEELRNKSLVLEKNNLQEFKDGEKLQASINRQKAVQLGLESECDELSQILEDSMAKLRILENEQLELERQNTQLQKLRLTAQKDADSLSKEKLERDMSAEKTEITLNEAIKEREEARLLLGDLQSENKLAENQHARLLQKLQKQLQTTAKVEQKVKVNLRSLGLAEREFEQTLNVTNSLKEENHQLAQRNLGLTESVKKQLREIELYDLQNEDLKHQIDVFLACEDEARKILNHRAPFQLIISNSNRQVNLPGKISQHPR